MKPYVIALALMPTISLSQSYGTEAGCAVVNGGSYTSDGRVIWNQGNGTLQFHETLCEVTQVAQIGSGGIALGTICSGEGETWEAWYNLYTTMDPDHYVLSSQDAPEYEFDLDRCN